MRTFGLRVVMALVLVAVCLVMGSGCSTINDRVPKTTINGSISGQPFEISTPKDSDLQGLDIRSDTNGVVSVHIEKLAAKMNPENITNTGAAEAAIIQATADAVERGIKAGAAAAGAAIGAAAK